jgi:Holliday junction resolvase RusA-like endonuclease
VPLELRVVFAVSRVSADVSNRVKALEDALTGIAWADDCQVVELFARKVVEPSEHVLGVVRVAAGVDETTQRRISQSKKAGAR